MKNKRLFILIATVFIILGASLSFNAILGCGGTKGDSSDQTTGVGEISGGVALTSLTNARSFNSSDSFFEVLPSASQKVVSPIVGKGMKLASLTKFVTDTAVSGTATLNDLEDVLVASVAVVNGEFVFSSIPVGTYKLIVVLDTPLELATMQLFTYVDVTEGDVVTARPDPLSTITAAAAEYTGNILGIRGNALDGFDLDVLITKIRDCYETLVDQGMEGEFTAEELATWESDPLDLATLMATFETLPEVCKSLAYTSFARGMLIAAGSDPTAVSQAMCEILHTLGFIISLNSPNQSFCFYRYEGSPFVEGDMEYNYCPSDEPAGCAEGETLPIAVLPTSVEIDRNNPEDVGIAFLPIIDEYSIMSMAKAYVDGVTVTPDQIYDAMVNADALGLRLCFESSSGVQYCFAPDGTPIVNIVYDEETVPRLGPDDTKVPTCHEALPLLCDEGESIGTFTTKSVDNDAIKHGIIFKKLHVPWNKTGGATISVVFDADPYAGGAADPVRVDIVRDIDLNITSVTQAVDGDYYLGFDDYTNEIGSTIPIDVLTGQEMIDPLGKVYSVMIADVTLLPGVDVFETGYHLFEGPGILIAGWEYPVLYDTWQTGAAPIEVCVSYSDHYTIVQNEDGTCDADFHYLVMHDTSEIDNTANMMSSVTSLCALIDPAELQSPTNTCVEWPLDQITGLNDLEYRDVHNYVFSGDVANPSYDITFDPYFDDMPVDLCAPADDGDGIWCSPTLLAEGLCTVEELSFSWRPYLANAVMPYSVADEYYRWMAEKSFVKPDVEGGAVQTIVCGDPYDTTSLPPQPDDEGNILPDLSAGDTFSFFDSLALNGITPRNLKARINTFSVGRPNAILNMASIALGGKTDVTPTTEFNVIEAFAMVYMAMNIDSNVAVAEMTLPEFVIDPESGDAVDLTLTDEIFHTTFFMPDSLLLDPFQLILSTFGISDTYLDDSTIWDLF
ncbi:MAG: hypothetical protein ABIE74_08315 [Pseudomonadota bacterium]